MVGVGPRNRSCVLDDCHSSGCLWPIVRGRGGPSWPCVDGGAGQPWTLVGGRRHSPMVVVGGHCKKRAVVTCDIAFVTSPDWDVSNCLNRSECVVTSSILRHCVAVLFSGSVPLLVYPHLADDEPDRICGEKALVQRFPLNWPRVPEVFYATDTFRPFRGRDLLIDAIKFA